jgi:hypothetical protein
LEFHMTSHNTVQLTLLNEVTWKQRLGAWGASLLGKKGPSQNISGRQKLEQTMDRVTGELQTYLGMRDMDLVDLTPQVMSKFLASVGIGADPLDIPSNQRGIVDRKTVNAIVKDLSIKAITGEPMEYQKPNVTATRDPFGLGGVRPPVPVTKPAAQQTSAASPATPPSYVGAPATTTSLSVDPSSWSATQPPAAGKPKTARSAETPTMPTAPAAGKPKTARSAETPTMPTAPAAGKPKTLRTAKSTPTATPPVMPAGTTPPAAKKSRKPRKQSESLNRLIDSVNRMSSDAYLKMSMPKYSKLTQILESLSITLKDIGLWRVLKESTDRTVVLRKR